VAKQELETDILGVLLHLLRISMEFLQ